MASDWIDKTTSTNLRTTITASSSTTTAELIAVIVRIVSVGVVFKEVVLPNPIWYRIEWVKQQQHL